MAPRHPSQTAPSKGAPSRSDAGNRAETKEQPSIFADFKPPTAPKFSFGTNVPAFGSGTGKPSVPGPSNFFGTGTTNPFGTPTKGVNAGKASGSSTVNASGGSTSKAFSTGPSNVFGAFTGNFGAGSGSSLGSGTNKGFAGFGTATNATPSSAGHTPKSNAVPPSNAPGSFWEAVKAGENPFFNIPLPKASDTPTAPVSSSAIGAGKDGKQPRFTFPVLNPTGTPTAPVESTTFGAVKDGNQPLFKFPVPKATSTPAAAVSSTAGGAVKDGGQPLGSTSSGIEAKGSDGTKTTFEFSEATPSMSQTPSASPRPPRPDPDNPFNSKPIVNEPIDDFLKWAEAAQFVDSKSRERLRAGVRVSFWQVGSYASRLVEVLHRYTEHLKGTIRKMETEKQSLAAKCLTQNCSHAPGSHVSADFGQFRADLKTAQGDLDWALRTLADLGRSFGEVELKSGKLREVIGKIPGINHKATQSPVTGKPAAGEEAAYKVPLQGPKESREEVDRLKQEVETKSETIETLTKDLQTTKEALQTAKETLKTAVESWKEAEAARKKAEISLKKAEHAKATPDETRRADEAQKRANDARQQVIDLEKEVRKLRGRLADHENEKKEKENQLKEQQIEQQMKHRAALQAKDELVNKAEERTRKLLEERQVLVARIEAEDTSGTDYTEMVTLRNELESEQKLRQKAERSVDTLKSQLAHYRATELDERERKTVEGLVHDLEKKMSKFLPSLDNAENELSHVEAELAAASAKLERRKQRQINQSVRSEFGGVQADTVQFKPSTSGPSLNQTKPMGNKRRGDEFPSLASLAESLEDINPGPHKKPKVSSLFLNVVLFTNHLHRHKLQL
jgi:hypothetical protein